MRYFLIDRVTELVVGERARGVKCVTLTDEVLHDHFPDHPILPGALIIEGASQLAGFLLEATFNANPRVETYRPSTPGAPPPAPRDLAPAGHVGNHCPAHCGPRPMEGSAPGSEPETPPVRAILAQIQQAKFYDMATPGDRLEFDVRVASLLDTAARVTVEVAAGEKRIARADLTFVLRAIDSEKVHEQRRYIYRLWTRDLANPPPIP